MSRGTTSVCGLKPDSPSAQAEEQQNGRCDHGTAPPAQRRRAFKGSSDRVFGRRSRHRDERDRGGEAAVQARGEQDVHEVEVRSQQEDDDPWYEHSCAEEKAPAPSPGGGNARPHSGAAEMDGEGQDHREENRKSNNENYFPKLLGPYRKPEERVAEKNAWHECAPVQTPVSDQGTEPSS